MLWMNYNGDVGALGTSQGNVTLGGHTWSVCSFSVKNS